MPDGLLGQEPTLTTAESAAVVARPSCKALARTAPQPSTVGEGLGPPGTGALPLPPPHPSSQE